LRATIRLSSLEVLDQIRDDDRRELHRVMNQEVLEIARFPEAKFESSQIVAEQLKPELYRVNISGPLTLHGVTNTHSFRAQVALGVDSLRSYGEFAILQTDYGIRIASIAGGTLKLQDELKFSFYVVARKQA
jgi:polyisoprenoid-binding protein YceI